MPSGEIRSVEWGAYCVPTDGPEADGTLAWDATTLVVVHVHAAGRIGGQHRDGAGGAQRRPRRRRGHRHLGDRCRMKSRLLGVRLGILLGAARSSVPVYASGGFTTWPRGTASPSNGPMPAPI
jgi:hypothetical protein